MTTVESQRRRRAAFRPAYVLGAMAVIILGVLYASTRNMANHAETDALQTKIHLDETNGDIHAMKIQLRELEKANELDQQRLGEIEATIHDRPSQK